jgi:F0F1-type ATP synthase membrane subunit b/b'
MRSEVEKYKEDVDKERRKYRNTAEFIAATAKTEAAMDEEREKFTLVRVEPIGRKRSPFSW